MAKLTLSERDAKRLGKMLRWYETQAGGGGPPEADGLRGRNEPSITFLNDSGETIPAYSIIELAEGGLIGEIIPYVKAVKPTADSDKRYAVNGPVGVEKEKYGQCYLAGVVQFAYDTGTPEIGDMYGPEDGEWTATLDGTPEVVECLGVVDETNKVAIGLIYPGSGGDSIIGKLDGAITATGSATLSVWTGTPGSESDSGDNVTVYNWGAGAVASGAKVAAAKIGGNYYLINASYDVRWDGTNHKLQDSTDDGTTWTDIDTAVTCT